MNEFYLVIVSASVGALFGFIANLALEAYRHKNAVSKTVQDKLHYERVEVIRELHRKLMWLQFELKKFSTSITNDTEKLDDHINDFGIYFAENELLLSEDIKSKIKDFKAIYQKIYKDAFVAKRNIKGIDNNLFKEITEKIPLMREELSVEFSKLLGVK